MTIWPWWKIEGAALLYGCWLAAFFAVLDYGAWKVFGWNQASGYYVGIFVAAWCGYSRATRDAQRR